MLSENQSIRRYCYPLIGFCRLKEPGIRWFVLAPLLINVIVFVGMGWLAVHEFGRWVNYLVSSLPGWMEFIKWLLWPLFAALILLLASFTFTLIASIIASPFNAFLAEYIQKQHGFQGGSGGLKEILSVIPASLAREMGKLAYYLPRVAVLLVISFIPVINLVSPLLWFLFSAWMMAIQYIDYPADNRSISFQNMLQRLKKNRIKTLLFGCGVLVMAMIPLLNLFIMPSAVIGAASFWEENT